MKMKRGELAKYFAEKFDSEEPEIHVSGSGRNAYLWIGGVNGPCYATMSGVTRLDNLARSILKAIGRRKP